ncbi:DUF4352 domain-containing protein [Haloplanus ruber]|uniref:DUF4352 domain-containing protein n=1 Tax=Haloplanus ruber TaxID=869892 RepID=A0ABD6CZ82_9EURY|nr:DUF4352 domain-containing protein [Haloplanus ruber]
MRRRAFLASAGIAALAGCSNGDGSNTATPTGTESGTSTPAEGGSTETATGSGTTTRTGDGSAEFEFRDVEAPEQVTLNIPTTFALGVRNTGSAEGTFTATLETRRNGEEWRQGGNIEMTLAAGETGEWHSPRFSLQYLGTYEFRLTAFDETWSIEATPRQLDFNNYYVVPTGLYMNVLGGSFEPTYPTPDDGTNETTTTGEPTPTMTATPESTETAESTPMPRTPAPEAGGEWAVMRIDVRNSLDEAQTTPDASEFVLEVDGERRPQHQEVSDDPYEGGELAARTVTRGDLVYAVPEGTRARDVTLWWESSLPGGDVKVVWTK